MCTPLWRLCAGDLRVGRVSPLPRVSSRVQLPPLRSETEWASLTQHGDSLCSKLLPIPRKPTPIPKPPSKPRNSRKPPTAPSPITSRHPTKNRPSAETSQLFTVSPDIDTEALLANASEDLLSISAIAADLADDVEGSRRSVALALSRMADGVQLLVERVLDHHEALQMQLRAQAKV